ncbi:MAG TPA: hypothetical protein PLT38_12635, partial [Rubrivivax sp.]|nr:hypothetical protein [Rubrivivax sp.]
MSYILEALQRAERERSRGRAPGLHDPIPPAAGDGARRRRLHWPMAAGAALLVLGLLVVLDRAAQVGRGLGRVLAIELHLLVQALALRLQLVQAFLRGVNHALGQRE